MATKYTLYNMRPDRRFLCYAPDYPYAKSAALQMVGHTRNGIEEVEVWDETQPVFVAWVTDTNRVASREREAQERQS